MWLQPGFSVPLAAKFSLHLCRCFSCVQGPSYLSVFTRELCGSLQLSSFGFWPHSLLVSFSVSPDKSHSKLHGPGWAMITRSVLLAVSWVYSWLSGHPQTPPLSLFWAEGGLNFKAVTHLVNLRTSYTLSHQVEWLAVRRGKWQRCPEYRPLSLIFTPDFSGI